MWGVIPRASSVEFGLGAAVVGRSEPVGLRGRLWGVTECQEVRRVGFILGFLACVLVEINEPWSVAGRILEISIHFGRDFVWVLLRLARLMSSICL